MRIETYVRIQDEVIWSGEGGSVFRMGGLWRGARWRKAGWLRGRWWKACKEAEEEEEEDEEGEEEGGREGERERRRGGGDEKESQRSKRALPVILLAFSNRLRGINAETKGGWARNN